MNRLRANPGIHVTYLALAMMVFMVLALSRSEAQSPVAAPTATAENVQSQAAATSHAGNSRRLGANADRPRPHGEPAWQHEQRNRVPPRPEPSDPVANQRTDVDHADPRSAPAGGARGETAELLRDTSGRRQRCTTSKAALKSSEQPAHSDSEFAGSSSEIPSFSSNWAISAIRRWS